jgi:hypothetical protein
VDGVVPAQVVILEIQVAVVERQVAVAEVLLQAVPQLKDQVVD